MWNAYYAILSGHFAHVLPLLLWTVVLKVALTRFIRRWRPNFEDGEDGYHGAKLGTSQMRWSEDARQRRYEGGRAFLLISPNARDPERRGSCSWLCCGDSVRRKAPYPNIRRRTEQHEDSRGIRHIGDVSLRIAFGLRSPLATCGTTAWAAVMAGGRRGLVAPQNTFLENIVRRSNGKAHIPFEIVCLRYIHLNKPPKSPSLHWKFKLFGISTEHMCVCAGVCCIRTQTTAAFRVLLPFAHSYPGRFYRLTVGSGLCQVLFCDIYPHNVACNSQIITKSLCAWHVIFYIKTSKA